MVCFESQRFAETKPILFRVSNLDGGREVLRDGALTHGASAQKSRPHVGGLTQMVVGSVGSGFFSETTLEMVVGPPFHSRGGQDDVR